MCDCSVKFQPLDCPFSHLTFLKCCSNCNIFQCLGYNYYTAAINDWKHA